ncbi:hypothetical protein CDL15_Pgr005030 [Punica granatum]|uniref:Secreted protein n=1 Tax=Punica granatum TaxID=22663 RepID=A0A218WJZ6_PUNGR|nr:hypothetical protein CDL15_Pgr005030 [Punica granatum]
MNSATVSASVIPRFLACLLPLIASSCALWWPQPLPCSSCLWLRTSASIDPTVNSDLSFGRVIFVGASGPKWGADSLPLFGCRLDLRV